MCLGHTCNVGLCKPRPKYLLSEVYVYRPTLHDVGAILFVKCEKSKLEMLADPELQALARVAQTHISLLRTL